MDRDVFEKEMMALVDRYTKKEDVKGKDDFSDRLETFLTRKEKELRKEITDPKLLTVVNWLFEHLRKNL